MPISFRYVNIGPPYFLKPLKDIYMIAGEILVYKFPEIKDPDIDDELLEVKVDFGKAKNFIKGRFPLFYLAPLNNETDSGIYSI